MYSMDTWDTISQTAQGAEEKEGTGPDIYYLSNQVPLTHQLQTQIKN